MDLRRVELPPCFAALHLRLRDQHPPIMVVASSITGNGVGYLGLALERLALMAKKRRNRPSGLVSFRGIFSK